MSINLIHLTSDVHNEGYIDRTLDGFVKELENNLGEKFIESSVTDAGRLDMPIIFVKSGGVEGKFKEIYENLCEPYLILASGLHNSFAASLEILTFLKQKGKRAEILHGDPAYIAGRIRDLERIFKAKSRLKTVRLGAIGKPSDWLIASGVCYDGVRKRLGVEIVDIGMDELVQEINKEHKFHNDEIDGLRAAGFDGSSVDGALKIYGGLKAIVNKYNLQCITVRCFDLLGIYKNTGCIGLSLLNDEGIIAGCEGDVPSVLSMLILNCLTSEPVFMANPSSINVSSNEVILAHCTLPLKMASNYYLDTHFESKMGVGIRGVIETGRGTMFKMSGDCEKVFVSGMNIEQNLNDKNLCRTQIKVGLDEDVKYFLKSPIGNHHIVCKGDYSSLIKEFFTWL